MLSIFILDYVVNPFRLYIFKLVLLLHCEGYMQSTMQIMSHIQVPFSRPQYCKVQGVELNMWD